MHSEVAGGDQGFDRLGAREAFHTGPLDAPGRFEVSEDDVTSPAVGGEGLVYRAVDTECGAAVALKLLTVVGPADFERLRARSEPFSHMSHPNLMIHRQVFVGTALTQTCDSALEDFDVVYSVADWVEGVPLGELASETQAPRLLGYVSDVARAVHALHSYRSPSAPHGLVHRDVKPSNVRVTADQTAVLIDFGVARPVEYEDVTQGVGTYRWRAPEVLSGASAATTAIDVWGVGAIAYWVLLGQPPGLDGAAAAVEQLINGPRSSELAEPIGVAAHIAQLLATNPAARPDDLARWADRLEILVDGKHRARRPGRAHAKRAAVALTALTAGICVNAAAGDLVLDGLTPTDVPVDPRVVVVSLDGSVGPEVIHRRATSFRDVATIAESSGASAVGLVGFDSLGFSDGALGRTNVVGSSTMQSLVIAPLIDAEIADVSGGIPLLTGYRVDPLASELAGIGLPAGRRDGIARSVDALARTSKLEDGSILDVTEAGQAAHDRIATTVVPAMVLRLVELGAETPLSRPAPDGVRLGERAVPLENGDLLVRWSTRLDDVDDPNVVSILELVDSPAPDQLLRGSFVLVGPTDPAVADQVNTPVGPLPEVLVHANALNTVLTEQYVRSASRRLSLAGAAAAALAVVLVPARRKGLIVLTAAAISTCWLIVVRAAAGAGWRLESLSVPVSAVVAAILTLLTFQFGVWMHRRRLRAMFGEFSVASTVPGGTRVGNRNRRA